MWPYLAYMIGFPRDTEDRIEIDDSEVSLKPSRLGSVSDSDLPRGSFNRAVISTHCCSCLKKHKLDYSDRFPCRITFVCGGCGKTNKIANISKSSSLNYATKREVLSRMKRRVRNRESRLAGMKYAVNNPTEKSRLVESYRSSASKKLLASLVFGVLLISILIISVSMLSGGILVSAVLGELVLLVLFTSILSSTGPELPEDPYIRIRSRKFIKGMKSPHKISKEFLLEDEKVKTTESNKSKIKNRN